MEKEIDRFDCADANGKVYTVLELEDLILGQLSSGAKASGKSTRLTLIDGSTVVSLNDNTYEIYVSETFISKI